MECIFHIPKFYRKDLAAQIGMALLNSFDFWQI